MSESQRQEQKNQTRRHLIEVAFQQLAKDGLSTARTADIAVAAGVCHGTVFAHFPTREVLLQAVLDEFGARVAGRLHQLAEDGGGVRGILEAHIAGLAEFEPFYARLVSEESLLPENARLTLLLIQSAISFHLSQAVKEETEAGLLRPIQFSLLFNTWLGLVHYYITHPDLFAPGESVLARHGPILVEHFLSLIKA